MNAKPTLRGPRRRCFHEGIPINDDEIWEAVDLHRLRTVELLRSLSEEEWRQQSLCDQWTVREVAAHLSLQEIGLGAAVLMAMRHPGGINRMLRESSRRRAKLPEERIIDEIRATVGSRRPNISVTCREALIDILVHSQDIAIPLGRRIDVEPAAAAEAASRVWSYAGSSKARVFKRIPLDGLRFNATDTAWSAGSGQMVEGPIVAILLILTGRLAALPMLSGDGAATLAKS